MGLLKGHCSVITVHRTLVITLHLPVGSPFIKGEQRQSKCNITLILIIHLLIGPLDHLLKNGLMLSVNPVKKLTKLLIFLD